MCKKTIPQTERAIMRVRLSFWKPGNGDQIIHPSTELVKTLIKLRKGSRNLIYRDLHANNYHRMVIKDMQL